MLNTLPEASAAQRLIPGEKWYGYEFYKPDILVDWVSEQAKNLGSTNNKLRPLVIDVGGASGFKAMSLAQQGCDVTIIDRYGTKDVIDSRNKILASKKGAGKIELHVGDIRKLEPEALTEICGPRSPKIVTSFFCLHFLEKKELEPFFKKFSHVSNQDTLLAVSYHRLSRYANGSEKELIFHKPHEVIATAEKSGFRLVKEFPEVPDYGITRQAFRLNK